MDSDGMNVIYTAIAIALLVFVLVVAAALITAGGDVIKNILTAIGFRMG